MPWKSTTNLRARITERERYNKYLRSEVRRQHEKLMRYREVAKDAFANIDRNEKRLFLTVHDMRRSDDGSFALGWNQAVSHIEKRITELLGVDLKSASEEMG